MSYRNTPLFLYSELPAEVCLVTFLLRSGFTLIQTENLSWKDWSKPKWLPRNNASTMTWSPTFMMSQGATTIPTQIWSNFSRKRLPRNFPASESLTWDAVPENNSPPTTTNLPTCNQLGLIYFAECVASSQTLCRDHLGSGRQCQPAVRQWGFRIRHKSILVPSCSKQNRDDGGNPPDTQTRRSDCHYESRSLVNG